MLLFSGVSRTWTPNLNKSPPHFPEEKTNNKARHPKPYKRQETPEYHAGGILAIFKDKV